MRSDPEMPIRETREAERVQETQPVTAESAEISAEMAEMDAAMTKSLSEAEAAEQREMDEGAKLGYSSSYYEQKMANALENGNRVAYDYAKSDWAKAKAREETRKW